MAKGMHVIVQTAPAVRAAIGEEFGERIGTPATGKMVAALKRLGFAKVYDTDFGADLTIMEEATELLQRVQNGGVLSMITSCSPGWINYCEYNYGDCTDHLSSCKSPHEMEGAIIKTYYAQKNNIDPKDIFVVSIMPCTAKKFEKDRPEMGHDGLRDVDAVLTTRELAVLIRRSGIRWDMLPNEDFDILETYRAKRAAALYSEDERNALRQSHNNPQVKALYEQFLGEPCGHKSHELLHTHYNSNRERYR